MKRILLLMLAVLALGGMSGCALKSGVDLLTAPKPNKDNQAITDELDAVKSKDAVPASPYAGTNRNSVQMKDLDGDGVEEVVALYQTPAGGNTFEVIVLSKQDDKYVCVGRIEGTGTRINTVDYPVLTSDGHLGILIGWRQVGDVESRMSMADYTGGAVRTLLEENYTSMLSADLDSDGVQELLLLNMQQSGERKHATVYEYNGTQGMMELRGEALVSNSAKVISKVYTGYIADRQPAVFAEEKIEGGSGQQTDIFVYGTADGLRNLALDTETGVGVGTYRSVAANAYDVNSDGMTEIPRAVRMVGYDDGTADGAHMLDWYLYSASAQPQYVTTTYRNVSQGWDFTISDSWRDAVRVIKGTENGMEYTCFTVYNPQTGDIPLLTIYYLLGDEAERQYDDTQDLIQLGSTSSARIVGYIPSTAVQSSLRLDEEQVRQRFSLVAADWSAPQS